MVDMVNHPPHYETNGIECIDAMRASQGDEAVQDFCICNAFKYIWRSSHKGSEIEDLKKAVWYLNKAIEIEENNTAKVTIGYRCRRCGLTIATSSSPLTEDLLNHLKVDHDIGPDKGYSEADVINNWYEEIYKKEKHQ